MKIKAIANIDNKIINCCGEITLQWPIKQQAYISWQLSTEDGKNLVSKSENFYVGENAISEGELINKIIEKIKVYTIGRKKIFQSVELVGEISS